jgi:hypothetical protein
MYWLVIYIILSGQPYEFIHPQPFADIHECAAAMTAIQQDQQDHLVRDAGCRSDDRDRAAGPPSAPSSGERP